MISVDQEQPLRGFKQLKWIIEAILSLKYFYKNNICYLLQILVKYKFGIIYKIEKLPSTLIKSIL